MSETSERQGRQPGGIYVVSGAKLALTNIRISFDDHGIHVSEPLFQVALDMTEKWLLVSQVNVREAANAATELDKIWMLNDNDAVTPLLNSEFFYSIQAVCASAFALDAFYASVKDHIEIPQDLIDVWDKNRTSRASRILQTFQRGFIFGATSPKQLKAIMGLIFDLRNKAVHPSPEMGQPMYHPRLNVAMPWHFVAFREENARNSYGQVLSILSQLVLKPRPQYGRLVEYCSTLRDQMAPLIADWEAKRVV